MPFELNYTGHFMPFELVVFQTLYILKFVAMVFPEHPKAHFIVLLCVIASQRQLENWLQRIA